MAVLGLTVFGSDLASEPHFVDESAYISQSFYADLFVHKKWDDPLWLTYAGYDLPPLPKYVVGLALNFGDHRRPGPSAMVAWYGDTRRQFVSLRALVDARRPSVVFGVIGCLSIYALGTIALDRRLGLVAALLLMVNPLYALHARRAMSDVMAESLLLAALAVGLWAWGRILAGRGGRLVPAVTLALGSGGLAGLSTLAKLNGSLAGMILAAWALLAVVIAPRKSRAIVLATLVAGGVSFATFVALNPFLYAHPKGPIDPAVAAVARLDFLGRVRAVSDHRINVSANARSLFPNDALVTAVDRSLAMAVQGFGRFGPFGPRGRSDSTIRFDWAQDRGALIWLPWVALGGVAALSRGVRQLRAGRPPTAWAIVGQAGLALVVVTSFIPLAWDRYFLSIQPGSALLAGFAAVEVVDRLRPSPGRKPQPESLA